MVRKSHQASATETDGLTARQREQAVRLLAAVLALLKARIDETRRPPNCAVDGAVTRGRSSGLRPYGCKGCGKTFKALTGSIELEGISSRPAKPAS